MSYQFPTLTIEDCVKRFQEMNIEIEEHDFRKPDHNRWFDIYCQVLEAITEVPFENILQKTELQAKAFFEFPELHEDSLPLMTLTVALQRFLGSCGISDFTTKDLLTPKTSRLLKFSSAVVNFLLFKQTRMEVYLQKKEKEEKYRERCENLKKSIELKKKRIQAIKSKEAEQEPIIRATQEEVDFLNQKMDNHYKTKAQQQQYSNELREKIAERKAQTDKICVAIAKSKEEIELISKKIIQSPERVMGEEDKAREILASLKCSIEGKREVLMEKHKQLEEIKLSTDNVQSGIKLCREIQADVEKINETDREIQAMKDNIREKKDVLRELQLQQEKQKHLGDSILEKMSKLKFHHQQKMKSAQETIQQRKEEKAFYERKRGDDEKKKNSYVLEKQRIIQEVACEEKALEHKIEIMQNLYAETITEVDKYNVRLGEGWQSLKAVMK